MTTNTSWTQFFQNHVLKDLGLDESTNNKILNYVSLFDKVVQQKPSEKCIFRLLQTAEEAIVKDEKITIAHMDEIIHKINNYLGEVCPFQMDTKDEATFTCIRILENMKYEFDLIKRKKFQKRLDSLKKNGE